MKIVLIGYRGSGKSTLGKQLASKLGMTFIDTDHFIEGKTHMSIPEIFSREGEAGFRQRETLALQEALNLGSCVIATGGGIVIRSENRLLLRTADVIVYLNAPVSTLIERTKNDTNRPALTHLPHQQETVALLQERTPLYEDLADITIDTHTTAVDDAVSIIVKKVKKEPATCKNC